MVGLEFQAQIAILDYTMRRVLLLGFLIIHLVSIPVEGSSRSFQSSLNFPDALAELYREVPNEQQSAFGGIVQRLTSLYQDGLVSAEADASIESSLQMFMQGPFLLIPDVMNYLTVLDYIFSHREADILFQRWNAALRAQIQQALPSQTSLFMQWSSDLFTRNILSTNRAVTWMLSPGDWEFDFTHEGSVVALNRGAVKGFAGRDSTMIRDTSGRFLFNTNMWEGSGGKVSWQRTGWHPDSVYAMLHNYSISMSGNGFTADSALLYHNRFNYSGLPGRFTERLKVEVVAESAIFPQFQSYDNSLVLENVFPGIHLRGGFQLEGKQASGIGKIGRPASLEIHVNGQKAILARSLRFVFSPGEIFSSNTSVSIYIGTDSIWHGRASLKYVHADRQLSLVRDGQGALGSPFVSSFHKVDITNEAIYWQLDSHEIYFQAMRGVQRPVEVSITSHYFFNQEDFDRIKGINEHHPLSNLATFSRLTGTQEFYVFEYARFAKRLEREVRQEMIHLNSMGFVHFFEDEDRIVVTSRLFHALRANGNLADYNYIRFRSNAAVVARLDRNSNNLYISGVEKIPLSVSKNVQVLPNNQEVVLKNNLNFEFDGLVEAGLLSFYGLDFFFDYKQFYLEMGAVDSLIMRVVPFEDDPVLRRGAVRIANVLRQLNGNLFIDAPENKSGRLPLPAFPYFTSFNESFVHFSDGFLSTRDFAPGDLYFKIFPFILENIHRIRANELGFEGVLVTSGIFPEVGDIITVQEDYTLGFVTQSPEEGLPIYGELGNFVGELALNPLGLNITGNLNILGAEMTVSELLLFPERASGVAQNLVMNPGVSASKLSVTAQMADIQIDPFQENFKIQSRDKPIELYDGQALLTGSLTLNPARNTAHGTIVTGNGKFRFDNAELYAHHFTFQDSELHVYNNQNIRVLEHTGFSGMMNMQTQQAEFAPYANNANLKISGPGLWLRNFSYIWNLQTGVASISAISPNRGIAGLSEVELLDLPPSSNEIGFAQPEKASLRFHAGAAEFDTHTQQFKAFDVPYLPVADAAVFPPGNYLEINPEGKLQPFERASIIASRQNRYHRFYNARVEVISGKDFQASGYYDFVNNTGTSIPLFFHNISPNTRQTTFAEKVFADSIPLLVHERVIFQGRMQIHADRQLADFRGFAKIVLDCEGFNPEWFSINQAVNPRQLMVEVGEQTRSTTNRQMKTGLMIAMDSLHVYPAFLSMPKSFRDRPVTIAGGYLTFNNQWNRFEVTTSEKMGYRSLPHQLVTINALTCVMETEGTIDFGVDLGRTRPESFGFARHNPEDHSTELEVIIGLRFLFADRAMRQLSETIQSIPFIRLNPSTRLLQQFFRTTSESNLADFLASEASNNGSISRFPSSLMEDNLLLSANLRWDSATQSFIAGQSIGVMATAGQQIFKQIPARLEIKNQSRGGDSFTLLLLGRESTQNYLGSTWYFFQKRNNVMASLSSNQEFNDAISRMNVSRRRLRPGGGLPSYSFILAPSANMFEFFNSGRSVSLIQ